MASSPFGWVDLTDPHRVSKWMCLNERRKCFILVLCSDHSCFSKFSSPMENVHISKVAEKHSCTLYLQPGLNLLHQTVDTFVGNTGRVQHAGVCPERRDFLHCHTLHRQLGLSLPISVVGGDAFSQTWEKTKTFCPQFKELLNISGLKKSVVSIMRLTRTRGSLGGAWLQTAERVQSAHGLCGGTWGPERAASLSSGPEG